MRDKPYRSPSASPSSPARGPKGDRGEKGDPGPPGAQGETCFLAVSESSSSELYGVHPQGFARICAGGDYLECGFQPWEEGDILTVEFWCQSLSQTRLATGSILAQAQVSTDSGSTWHGLSGARLHLPSTARAGSVSSSIVLNREPLVRLFVTQYDSAGPDYGPGPEGSTLLLRCTRYRAGTFSPSGRLMPPLS